MPYIKCTKCGSTNISNQVKNPPEPQYETMDEYVKGTDISMSNLMMDYTPMILVCTNCGYSVEYTSPRGTNLYL